MFRRGRVGTAGSNGSDEPAPEKRRRIEVVDYDPAWPGAFEEARAAIERLLGGLVLEIHHIGSTSVPGLCAKPKIDVDIVLRSAAEIRRPSSA